MTSSAKIHILYIVFIDLDEAAKSGSSVRPQQMKKAFEELGCELTILQGLQNRVTERKRNVREVIRQIEQKVLDVDFCYIEPPAGPFFCREDLKLIALLHKRNVPVSLFYRDAYWLVKDSYQTGGILKSNVIRFLHKRDLRCFEKHCDIIYVPSDSFASFVGFKTKTKALPPACPSISSPSLPAKKSIPTAIFVGSATKEYGIFLILDAFQQVNAQEKISMNLRIVCPESNWRALPSKYQALVNEEWLSIHHAQGEDQLTPLYADSDVALLPYIQVPYNDMAMPVKLFEYIAYEKPIVTTNCLEKAIFVQKWGIGLICEDNPDSLAKTIKDYLSTPELKTLFLKNLKRAHQNNLWTSRAKSIINDMTRKDS